jgi:hypothetical protein
MDTDIDMGNCPHIWANIGVSTGILVPTPDPYLHDIFLFYLFILLSKIYVYQFLKNTTLLNYYIFLIKIFVHNIIQIRYEYVNKFLIKMFIYNII